MAKAAEAGRPDEAEPASSRSSQTYRMTKKSDPRIGLILARRLRARRRRRLRACSGCCPAAASSADPRRSSARCCSASLAALIVFGRRAQKAAYAQIEGQPGAAAAALGMLRRGWKTDPAIAFTKQQDVVHRVVGPPGIVLVGEGNPNRLQPLLATERRKHERVAAETPIHEVVVRQRRGRRCRCPSWSRHVTKLGRDGQARRDDRRAPPAQGARRQPLEHPAAQGPGADQHEGHARQHARPLSPERRTTAAPRLRLVRDAASQPLAVCRVTVAVPATGRAARARRAGRPAAGSPGTTSSVRASAQQQADRPAAAVGADDAQPGRELAEGAARRARSAPRLERRRRRAATAARRARCWSRVAAGTEDHDRPRGATRTSRRRAPAIRRAQDAVSHGGRQAPATLDRGPTPRGHLLHGRNKPDTVKKLPLPRLRGIRDAAPHPGSHHADLRLPRCAAKEDECSRTATSC